MAEAPAQTPPPRSFISSALTPTESQTVTDLLNYLTQNSYAYDSHVQLIDLLHKGFLSHVSPTANADNSAPQDPRSYGLLAELRQAREAMDTRFAVGENIWLDWLSDERVLAQTSEERIAVTEQFQKAVQDEPMSVKLWQAYAEWISSNYAACNDVEGAHQTGWSEEDKEVCRELFTRDMLANVLEQAATSLQWRIDQSHFLWNRYAESVEQDLPASPSPADVQRVRDMFIQRLRIPHASSAETAQMFWPIVNRFEGNDWEGIMAEVNELAEPARRQMGLRQEHELSLQRAIDSGDKSAIFDGFVAYLKWESKRRKAGPFDVELRCALHERALLHFPTHTEWWLDYIDFAMTSNASASVLLLLERATRHCPWSGDLWATRILRSDVEGKPHTDIEATKHRATNSGLLDVGGLEELMKVLQQWCSYLRRHAFSPNCTEDDLDTAEVGITMAIEDIQQAGQTLYGTEFKGDPLLRLEMIQTKFLSEARRFNEAREIYKRLVPMHKDSFLFWTMWYAWELMLWGSDRLSDAHRVETLENGPHLATAVIQQALSQRNLDSPERMLETYLNHFQQHESSEKLQAALIEARQFSKHLAARRAKEAEAAADISTQNQPAVVEGQAAPASGDKRKADDALLNGDSHKKTKKEPDLASAATNTGTSASASAQIKRDREHNTITVRNLPIDVHELDIKRFFRDVGAPLSISIMQDAAKNSATATVEFTSHEDVLAAQTRNGREIDGHEVTIASGSQSTLYVTNYPPEFDEPAIRKLFDSYGEIVSVRLPNLKYNSRRRFCYVQFMTETMARAAEAAMDGKMLDGQHRLLAKISNPEAKKQRAGAQAEGRELFVKNIDHKASEDEIKGFFSQYGEVVKTNLLKLVNNRRTGTGFIVFSSADEANAALAANNKPLKDRILQVEMATPKGGAAPMDKARKTDVIVKVAASASPEPASTLNGRRGSDVSMTSAPATAGVDEAFKTTKERKIAIFNLPDTVNDARIRAAMEQFGPIVKIQLRRQDHGAIVEFAQVQDAFNVRQGVDCSGLGEEVKTGDVADLLSKVRRRQGGDGGGGGGGGLSSSASGPAAPGFSHTAMRPTSVARPGQRGGGRRGGLGFKRGGLGSSAARGVGGGTVEGDGVGVGGGGGGKSNADFRAMLEKSKHEQPGKDDAAAEEGPR